MVSQNRQCRFFQSSILNPQSSILNPQSSILNPQSCRLHRSSHLLGLFGYRGDLFGNLLRFRGVYAQC